MRIFGIDITFQNANKRKPPGAKIDPIEREKSTAVQDIDRWRSGIQQAQNVYNHDRRTMQEFYNELSYDSHITTVMNHIVAELVGSDFHFAVDGETDEEATEVLRQRWFSSFIRLAVEAEFYGYTLIEFGDITEYGFSYVKGIDRRYVIPEYKGVKKDLYLYGDDKNLIKFEEQPFKDWSVFIDTGTYGLFNSAAPIWVYKKQSYTYWAEYQQLFSMPLRVGKTDIRDTQRRENMQKMLNNMGTAAWGVFDSTDEIEFIQSTGSIGNPVFQSLIELSNKEFSKLFLGQTMTTEDGSSLSQSEVHERTKETIMGMYYRRVEDSVNTLLLPLLVKHGMVKNSDLKFEFIWSEKDMDITQKVDTISKLAPYFDFDPEYIKEFLGVEVLTRKVQIPGSPLNRLEKYYGSTDTKRDI
jgi:phage gp29-like protein